LIDRKRRASRLALFAVRHFCPDGRSDVQRHPIRARSSTNRRTGLLASASPVGHCRWTANDWHREAKGLSQAELAVARVTSIDWAIETGVTRCNQFLPPPCCGARRCARPARPEWGTSRARRARRKVAPFRVSHASKPTGTSRICRFIPQTRWRGLYHHHQRCCGLAAAAAAGRQCPQGLGLYITATSMVPEFEPGGHRAGDPHLPCPEHNCIFYGAHDDEVRATISAAPQDRRHLVSQAMDPTDRTKAGLHSVEKGVADFATASLASYPGVGSLPRRTIIGNQCRYLSG